MSWIAVARKDFRDASRSKALWVLTTLFTLLVVGIVFFFSEISGDTNPGQDALFLSFIGPLFLLLPLAGILVGYKSIVGERESGSIKLLLSLPHTRGEVLLGKLVGRSAVVTTAVLIGYLLGSIAFVALMGGFQPVDYLLFVGLTVLLGITFVAIAVGLSASSGSSGLVLTVAIGLVLMFTLLWETLAMTLLPYALGDALLGIEQATVESISTFVLTVSPRVAFMQGLSFVLSIGGGAPSTTASSSEIWLNDWWGFVVLGFWIVVPLAVGYWRFKSADL
ncbi:MAG: ABC transporter permease subunit [Halanaeroarchaeum sp.]